MPETPKKINEELADTIINIIGEEKALEIYGLVAEQKVSFAAINKRILFKSLKGDIHNTTKTPTEIANQRHISRSTVYRLFKEELFQKKKLKK